MGNQLKLEGIWKRSLWLLSSEVLLMRKNETLNNYQKKTNEQKICNFSAITFVDLLAFQSKKNGKGQESIQSGTTPDPEYQWESDNFTIRHHKREPINQPFPST